MKQKSFVEFLRERHAEQYLGTDDYMPDDFEDWLGDRDNLDLIEYAEMWKEKIINSLNK